MSALRMPKKARTFSPRLLRTEGGSLVNELLAHRYAREPEVKVNLGGMTVH